MSLPFPTRRLAAVFAGLGISGCGTASDGELFEEPSPIVKEPEGVPCTLAGTWATFTELGVEWHSGLLRSGAGTVREWMLSERQVTSGGEVLDASRVCGVGAHGVPLGSPWFSTIEIARLLPQEWMGTEFLTQLFDRGALPVNAREGRVIGADPEDMKVDRAVLELDSTPHLFGLEGLPPDAPWPDNDSIRPYLRDHDGDGFPGIAGIPFAGQVPGEPAGVFFVEPRIELELQDPVKAQNPARASRLFIALRTRVSLRMGLTSCDPAPRFVGAPDPDALLIETHNVGCVVSGTSQLCSQEQLDFVDANLPLFEPNGTGFAISVKVQPGTTCAQVRDLGLEKQVR